MFANTSISEPFVLASYGNSSATGSSKDGGQNQSAVYATSYAGSSGSSDGLATVTAQGDGIHIFDLSTSNPVASQTLGPSTFFASPAVTQVVSEESKKNCTIYAAIQTSSDLSQDSSGRCIWIWEEDLINSTGSSRKKQEITLPHSVAQLYVSDELQEQAIALSPEGAMSIISRDGSSTKTRVSPLGGAKVFKSFCLSRRACTFLGSHVLPSNGAVVILVYVRNSKLQVSIIHCNDQKVPTEVGTLDIAIESEKVLDVSLSDSGFMTILFQNGSWYSYKLDAADAISVSMSPGAEKLQLTSLSFAISANTTSEASLLSLGSSHVLLAGITAGSTREIVLLLWDVQYSVLLASHSLPIPSTISQSKDVAIRLKLSLAKSHALLVLSPYLASTTRKSLPGPSTLRSSVLGIPFTVPTASTIANAMGRGASGDQWLKRPLLDDGAELGDARFQALESIRSAMEKGQLKAANDAFFGWIDKQKASSETYDNEALSHQFVQRILSAVLQPSKPHSSEVVQYLLQSRSISSNMVEGGLLSALRSKADWGSIEMALQNVVDLSEAEIMSCLKSVVGHHQRQLQSSQDSEGMEVDSTHDIPSLPTFLALCIQYPITPSTLRVAIREHFTDEDTVCCVLEAIQAWLSQLNQTDDPFKNSSLQNGLLGPPPLDKLILFLQCTIDATFVKLLQHRPAHRILQDIMSDIETEVAFVDQLGTLRGPLEVFAKAEAKAAKDAQESKSKKTSQTEWMQKRKRAHEQVGMAVGLYRLEELVI
ncbi:Nucleolar protein 11 [Pleurotus pulmonarius]